MIFAPSFDLFCQPSCLPYLIYLSTSFSWLLGCCCFSATPADSGEPQFQMLDLAETRLLRDRDGFGKGEVLDVAALGAEKMAVGTDLAIVAGAVHGVKPVNDAVTREFIQNAVDALACHGRQGLLDRFPHPIHVWMRVVIVDEREDRQPLGRTLPSNLPANLPELLMMFRTHLTRTFN
jgi:hypothetical protein